MSLYMTSGEDKATKPLKSEVAEKEEKILEFWNKNQIFKKTLEKESPNGNFVFYDGPPFATGLPHYGHILPGTIKDIIPRYHTMNGKRVLRRWGWDCHGLPIENLIEKELGLTSKKDIETLGVEKFNRAARNVVSRYSDEWKKIIPRSGRWIDMDNSYLTMDPTYTESVWWSFKTLYEKDLIYQGFKSMLLCPHCETTLSNFEVNQGYKDITDISVYVEFELVDTPNTFLIAWTTTPWTLPGNVALAVSPKIEYVEVEGEAPQKKYIIAKSQLESVFGGAGKIVREVNVKELVGQKYKPVFDYYNNSKTPNVENGWKVYAGDFVEDGEGTGIVHIAPAFGEEDMNLGKENNLPFVQHVNRDGTFKDEVVDFAGQKVKPIEDNQKTDVEIIKYLAKKGVLFKKLKIVHSYPHCWRCGTPLLNYASNSWFVKVTEMKDRLVEINKGVSWTPEEIGEGRFGKWLEGARDWAISRSRYWGAPLPVWENEDERVVLGSIDDLKKYTKKSGNKYFVMRHGESVHNLNWGISTKSTNSDTLTELGRAQSEMSAKTLLDKNIDYIVISPFRRTKETAEIVSNTIGLSKENIIEDERLHELGVYSFEGKTWQEYHNVFPKTKECFYSKCEGDESYFDAKKRVMEVLYEYESKYSNKNIVFITHGGPGWLMTAGARGLSIDETYRMINTTDNPRFDDIKNAEVRELNFVPLPHNENYELDLHRPYIDDVVLVGKTGKKLTRVPEIFDTWYDSGSMPFAQQHYPFENKDSFEQKNSPLFPADFIAEGLDQTRGWFYTLLVLGTGLFDKSPYNHVLVNGLVLAEDGRKMSKSLKNYPDLMDVVNKYGADTLRYYLVSSPLVKAEDFNFSEKGVDEIYKKLIQKLYNVLSFYEMYPAEKHGELKNNILDDWIISRLAELTENISTNIEKYELDRASRPILDFVDDLSTWYVRRSRDRFKSDDLNTRYSVSHYTAFVLVEFSKIVAPFIPFIAEEIYRRVGGKLESVHLENWPENKKVNQELMDNMQKVREVVTKALELRQKAGHKVRQPLALLTIPENFSKELLDIISDEVNVKEVKIAEGEIKLDTNLTIELKNEGVARDVIRGIQDARKTENLSPSDRIKIVVQTSDSMQSVLKSFENMIKSPTQVDEVSYSKDKQTYPIDIEGQEISISIIAP